MAWTFALIVPVLPILHRVSCSNGTVPNAPKDYETQQDMSFFPIGWIVCVRCDRFRRDLVAWTFALIAPVHTVLHRVSCSYGTITDEPKHYETYQNMSLGSNGVDWVRSLRKIPKSLRGTNFRINCTSSPYFAPSFIQLWNDPKCTQTLWNAPKHEFRFQWCGSGAIVVKISNKTSWHQNMSVCCKIF